MYNFFVWNFLQPYPLILTLMGLFIVGLWRKRREYRRRLLVVTVLYLILLVMSIPAVAFVAVASLERRQPPCWERPADTEAIVVLASAVRAPGTLRPWPDLDEDSLNRCLHAARLYHQGKPCLVLVSGGPADFEAGRPSCAAVMRETLLQLGVHEQNLFAETESETTYENAVESCKILSGQGINRIVLVTDAMHMDRALRCFLKQGTAATPSGCHFRATQFSGNMLHYIPSPQAVRHCQNACHEWLGVCWYWLHDRI